MVTTDDACAILLQHCSVTAPSRPRTRRRRKSASSSLASAWAVIGPPADFATGSSRGSGSGARPSRSPTAGPAASCRCHGRNFPSSFRSVWPCRRAPLPSRVFPSGTPPLVPSQFNPQVHFFTFFKLLITIQCQQKYSEMVINLLDLFFLVRLGSIFIYEV